MKFLVLGGGAQGSAAAYDLLRADGVEHVRVADVDVSEPAPFLRGAPAGRLSFVETDASDGARLREVMEGMDAVVCALPWFFNYDAAEAAVEVGAHYCDLGGNTELVERQRGLEDAAVRKGLSVIPDCGLAPGMVNILAQAGIDALDETRSVKIRVGGLPQEPEPPLNYQIVYSMQGVLDYYTTPSLVLERGEVREKAALSEVERVDFADPVGTLEAFHTAGGISTMPYRYEGVIPTMEYKTLRYPGHAVVMAAIRDLGLLSTDPMRMEGCEVSPRDFFIEVVSPKLVRPEGHDLVVLRVEAEGRRDGTDVTVRFDLVDRYDEETGITAMMRTTGFSLALTGLMQADGRVTEKGVRTPDEGMPADIYLTEMRKRGIEIERADF